MSNGTHLTIESTAPTQASLSPANGSPSNHSERSWSMIECVESTDSASSPESAARQRSLSRQSCSSIEATDSGQDKKKRSIDFVLQRRAKRLQEIRRLVKELYPKT
ncbi:uncharacterized protein LOC142569950 [Dermacentor variabilis]|uniref:uncharacterized protein LOC142569950 n=1 Tax=Dermacentor variabilis TaxID=34621 RepID=UPI003F5C2A4E